MIHRRDVLKAASLVPCLPALARQALLDDGAIAKNSADRITVMLELNGGNDGVNTVVPFRDEGYAKFRKTLRIPEDDLLILTDDLGLHPSLGGFAKLYERGQLAIVQGVGYPNPNLSHEVSLDVWHTAKLDRVGRRGYGWIGRMLDARSDDEDDANAASGAPGALLAGPHALPRALRSRRSAIATVPSLETYLEAGQIGSAALLDSKVGSAMGERIRRILSDARSTARSIVAAVARSTSETVYPQTRLARDLELIATLIRAEFETPVYYAIQPGYDTHSLQEPSHASRMQELGDALSVFINDMNAAGRGEDVTVIVFSEFGRRVGENASRGTDHGTAGPVFLAGRSIAPGLHGTYPSLTDLVDGDMKSHIDLRRVYGSLVEQWMGGDAKEVLGGPFDPLPLFRA